MGEQQEKRKKKPATLGYIQERWQHELEPVLRSASVGHEEKVKGLWERTLSWLKEERGLQGDSLRKPITQLRGLIKTLPLTAETTWDDQRRQKPQHFALRIFNLPEQEWERMNARSASVVDERLKQQQFLEQPDAIVNRGLLLVQSSTWSEVLVGLALGTGRRFWELVKTATFEEIAPYAVTFRGQVKGRGRHEVFEIPTLYRAFLVVEGMQRLRRLIDWNALEDEYSPLYQTYNRAANEMVAQHFSDLIPVRPTRERLNLHVLRAVFARIATYWYCPAEVADITFMAEIQGHRYILEPEVEEGETAEDIHSKQLNYAANANYFDYKIGRRLADGSWQVVGDQGIKLGLPGVTRLRAFPPAVSPASPSETERTRKGGAKKKKPVSTSEWSPLTIRRQSRDWFRDLSGSAKGSGSRQSERDDAFVRTLLTLYLSRGLADPAQDGTPDLSLETLDIADKTRGMFRQAMVLSGTSDLLSFLLAAAEPEAQRLVQQEIRHDGRFYETLSTADLFSTRDDPGARQELYRRAVSAVMTYNREHPLRERWYLSDRALQALVGGRKDFIKLYKEAHAEEIEAHHREWGILEGFNRKPGSPQIQDVVSIPPNATDFPWGRSPLSSDETSSR